MLSIILATCDSERALVPTLAALVPGATAGIVREVIVADGGSRDATEQVADIAGCSFLSSGEPAGARLKAAAATARAPWLMFLVPGAVPGTTWIDEVTAFVEASDRNGRDRAATFAPGGFDPGALLRRALGLAPTGGQGLIIRKAVYDARGGHGGGGAAPRGLGRVITLRTRMTRADI